MKHNWTYKKLGEVVTIERGGSPRPIQNYITTAENGLNWIKIGDAVEGSKYITSTKEKIKPEGLKKTRFVHKGDFILSNSMSFGRPYILGIDGCIHDGWLVLHDENQVFDKSYLYYYLSSPTIYEEFKRLAVGGVVNNLNSDIVRKVRVAIPSLDEQQAIVRELDGINHLIDLQELQLREYDNLAQSLFYSTFGDPIFNEKGWMIVSFEDNLEHVKYTTKIPSANYLPAGEFPIISQDVELISGYWNRAEDVFIIPRPVVIFGDHTRVLKYIDFDFVLGADGVRILLPKPTIDARYLLYCLRAIEIPNLGYSRHYKLLKELSIPLPPLALQQTFAAQIEAIEQQKALVRRSLDEARTLLAARMQYYFE